MSSGGAGSRISPARCGSEQHTEVPGQVDQGFREPSRSVIRARRTAPPSVSIQFGASSENVDSGCSFSFLNGNLTVLNCN